MGSLYAEICINSLLAIQDEIDIVPGKRPIIELFANDVPTEMLWDTGSSVTLLRENILNEMGLKV